MGTFWTGNKQISESEYNAIQAKNDAWTGPKVVDALTSTRQPSGKQPVPTPTASNPLGIIDVGENLDDYLKSPEGIAAAEEAKRMEEQLAAAASHGKEIVFEFSKPISSKASTYVSKLVKLLGGKRSYIEDQTKLVVVI